MADPRRENLRPCGEVDVRIGSIWVDRPKSWDIPRWLGLLISMIVVLAPIIYAQQTDNLTMALTLASMWSTTYVLREFRRK